MKKSIILLLCIALLCGMVAAGIAVVSARTESEQEKPSSESENTETPFNESINESASEPLDIPTVVTRSYIAGKMGEDTDLLQTALKTYAGQNTVYRIEVKVNWINQKVHLAFHSLINYDVTKCYECSTNRISDANSAYTNKFYGTLYKDKESYGASDCDFIPNLYGELNEESLCALLNCEGVTVELIDKFPEHLVPYNTPTE